MRTILIDTRQKTTSQSHLAKQKYFEDHGYSTFRSKLPVGDYAFADNLTVAVDTKQDLQEVCGNVIGDHERFRAECELANKLGTKLVVLVEQNGMTCLEDVKRWENPRMHRYNKVALMHSKGLWKSVPLPKKPTSSITLFKIMYTMEKRYGVHWEFCNATEAGRRVIEILEEPRDE